MRVHVLGTGGTIASRGGAYGGAVATDTVADLLGTVAGDLHVTSEDVMTTGSYRLGLRELRTIAVAAVEAARSPDIDGIVITHGTDTLEETAFLIGLVHDGQVPVVLTGAQRSADQGDSDGPRNLRQAILVAADPRFRGMGCLVSFDGRVQSARGVRKAHTTASQPFGGGTAIASFAGEEPVLLAHPVRRAVLPVPGPRFGEARVDVVVAYPGARPDVLRSLRDAGAQAVVLAGTGTGNAGPGYAEAVADLVQQGVPVVLASRTMAGPVVPLYGNGGGVDLMAAGAVGAGHLNPFQARILAACLLADDPSTDTFTQRFSEYR